MSFWIIALLQLSALAYGLLAGVFLAFSDFIMRALSKTSGAGGIEAMQHINREVFRWIFMALFLGMAPVSAGLVLLALLVLQGGAAILVGTGGATYLLACFLSTVLRNVPMNTRLEAMAGDAGETRSYWRETYLPVWTRWNSLRAGACALASGLLSTGALLLVA